MTYKEVEVELSFIPRSEKRLNKKGLAAHFAKGEVPAAVFGKSIEPGICFVSVRKSKNWHRGSMFDVSWQGKSFKASISEIQYHPVNHNIQHVSFHLVGKNEVTHIEVPFKVTGQAAGEKAGGMISLQRESVSLKGKPDHMPEYIEVDVTDLDVNSKITLADIPCPPNTEWYNCESDWAIVTCAHVKVQEVETPEEVAAVGAEVVDLPTAEADTTEHDSEKKAA